MQRIDLMEAIAQRPFFKEPKKRYGLVTTLMLSNVFWLICASILFTLVLSLTEAGSFLTSKFLEQTTRIAQLEAAKAAALAERDAKISRLLAYHTSSTTEMMQLARSVQKVYNTANNSSQSKFLDQALPEALRIQVTEGIPASAVLAQAIYESSYGTSRLSRDYHNYHGIKAFSGWSGPRATNMPTLEYGTTPIIADFRAYADLSKGFNGYAEFLKASDRYNAAFSQRTGVGFVQAVVRAGYCPDPSYMNSIRQIIARHNLEVLDEIYAAQIVRSNNTRPPVADANS